jgi:flagellar M-ring protein FliF
MGPQLLRAVDRLGSMARIVVALIAVATIGAIFYIVSSAGGAAYAPAFTGLDARSAARIESALAGGHIPSKLQNGGATVAVPSSMVDQARVLVGNAGITTTGHAGNDLLTTSGLFSGTSEQWDERVTEARSGVLATQIEAISGVQHAEVNLAIPPSSIFQQDQGKTTASIQVTLGGGSLTDSAVRGIVSLVANAVPGLAPQNVTVIDEHGNQLSSAGSAIGLQTADRFAAENAFFSSKTAIAQAALDRVLGPGNSSVVVAGHLNFDESTSQSRTFGNAAHGTISGSTETEQLQQSGGSGGLGGTAANIPGAVAGTSGSTSNYKHDVKSGTSALDTTETTTKKASGAPTDMQIALVVSKKAESSAGVNAATLQQIVENAVGYTGTVTPALNKTTVAEVNALPNAAQALKNIGVGVVTPTAAGASPGGSISSMVPAPFGGMLEPLGAILVLLGFLFVVRKALKKRQALLGTTDSSWLPALEAPPIRVDDLVAQVAGPSHDEIHAAERKALAGRVEELAQNRPADVAAQLRGWLASDE